MKFNLSEITDVIRNRRTITPEHFSDRKVHREQIELVLNNAIWAPSHGLTQPWRFKVFMDEGLTQLQQVLPELYRLKSTPETFKQAKYDKILKRLQTTNVVIAICMERDRTAKIEEIEEVEAVACAVQNMYLTCTAYGLGAFWATPKFIYSSEMNDFLKLQAEDKCLGLFYIGYPNVEWPSSHRKPLEFVTEWIDKTE